MERIMTTRTRKLEKTRLLTLADSLSKIPAKHFNLESFVNPNGYRYGNFEGIFQKNSEFRHEFKKIVNATFDKTMTRIFETLEEEPNCGTTACAVGWCPKIFPAYFSWSENLNSVILKIDEKEYYDFEAAKVFFGLTDDQSFYLFSPWYYKPTSRTVKHVVRRIKNVVKNGFPKKMREYTEE